MPVTFPAHQAVVLPIKLRWPARTDGTALCLGAAVPDLGYPLLGLASHSLLGVLLFAIPFTVVLAWVVRGGAASTVFGTLPDAGPFRLRSYRVLTERRPRVLTTVASAAIGAGSHVLLDAFSHSGRWGAQWLGLDRVLFVAPVRGEMTGARLLQYVGHGAGSLVAVGLLLLIGRRRMLERWYGAEAVAAARDAPVAAQEKRWFWSLAVGLSAALTLRLVAVGGNPTFSPILGTTVGVLAAGSLVGRRARSASNRSAASG